MYLRAEVIKTTLKAECMRKYAYVGIPRDAASMFNEMEEENDAVQ